LLTLKTNHDMQVGFYDVKGTWWLVSYLS